MYWIISTVTYLSFSFSPGRGNARMQGAAVAQGDIIVFVDGLVEMNVEWLSPLVQRLSKVVFILIFLQTIYLFEHS